MSSFHRETFRSVNIWVSEKQWKSQIFVFPSVTPVFCNGILPTVSPEVECNKNTTMCPIAFENYARSPAFCMSTNKLLALSVVADNFTFAKMKTRHLNISFTKTHIWPWLSQRGQTTSLVILSSRHLKDMSLYRNSCLRRNNSLIQAN